MKVIIASIEYTAIDNLSFAPEISVTGSEIPINEFELDVITTDNVDVGQFAYLYDDLDNLWAKYWIVYAEHADEQIVHLKAQSQLKLLERRMLDAVMYVSEPLSDILTDIFYELGSSEYSLDNALSSTTISGFCPEQSAKTRLQWVCFVSGAYVKSFFSDKINILQVDTTATFIPINKTFWKPTSSYTNYVTRVRARKYSYVQGTPSATDKWVACVENIGGIPTTVYYIESSETISIANEDVPSGTLTHEITIDDITIINDSNVSAILSYLSTYYFKRMKLEFDTINNAEYIPGDFVIAYQDESNLVSGYIEKAEYLFGTQARAKIKLAPVDVVESAVITIVYHYGNITILGKQSYTFPIGYSYEIENPWFDTIIGSIRYVFRPESESVTGTVMADATIDVYYDSVLEYEYTTSTLHIISVDGVNVSETDSSRLVIE